MLISIIKFGIKNADLATRIKVNNTKMRANSTITKLTLLEGGPTSALLWATFQNYSSLRASAG